MSSSSTSKHANDAKRKRANQSTQRGMGSLYESPKKSRATHGNISAPKTFVHDLKQEALKKQLASLRAEIQAEEDAGSEREDDDFSMDIDTDLNSGGLNDQIQQSDPPSQPAAFTTPPASPAPGRTPDLSYVPEPAPLQEENANNAQPGKRRRQAPNESAKSLYHRWEDLLPEIYAPYLKYMEQSYGQMALPLLPSTVRVCEPTCQETHKTSRILCLYPHHYQYIDFQWCTTSSLPVCLVRKGLFPTAPTRPGIAISLELLAFYKALFEHACDATTALAHALNAHYTRRGFVLVDKKGCLVGEPFRKGLGKAFQWYDCLLHKIELDVEAAVQSATKHWKEPGAADTSEADNDGADTSGADPSGADTSGADTSGADTSGAEADSSGTENSEARNKRIFLLDRHLKSLGFEMRANLGNLLTDKMQKNIPKHRLTAETMLERCAMSVPDLRREWEVQKQSQTSVRAQNQIKKELDSILKLQTNLDAVEKSISETRNFVENKHGGSHSSEDILDDLGKQQNDLMDKVEQLYASLNVDESFPELIGIDLDFFFEWDKVNQAKGGKGPTIGTKLHQYARRAIAKRTPTLLKAIRKFNKICGECAEIYRPEYNIPLPEVLPVDLHDLQHNSSILEDIWMSPASPDRNAWLYDSDVREAMRAVQQADRCQEEVKRLGIEFDNLCRWFGKELTSVELALVVPENAILAGPLSQYREKLLSYIPHWQTAQTQARYQYHRTSASDAAKSLSSKLNGQVVPVSYKWAEVVVLDLSGPQGNPFEDPSERGMDEEEEEPFIEAVANPVAISTPASAVTTLKSIRYDASLLDRLNLVPRNTDLGTQETTHRWFDFTLPGGTKATRHTFDDNALQSLRTPDVHLNNTTMEACAALLHHHALLRQSATANNSVIFSMFDLHMAMYSPDRLWEQVKGGSYWCKATWIIPLHRLYPVAHWVCAIIHPNTSDIYLFDSLDERKKWSSNLKELINFVDLLFGEAKGHGYSASSPDLPWKVFSLTQRPLQTSNNSCGLWVLATIASHLDGFHIPDIDEEGIGRFRQKLYAHISNLSPP
ncbi:hypothetical protein D9611_000326 [Ephemerocybe angulata]|uniref:Ubiquitin-like protease family profile domain-containing protein n=1 Tax=Ephemerocybe angulata TaxID=980116 RepID=A0A8H5BMK2_9AGAR|nr:hypothetical protein D9611_000326 [Tulosesus angulatus]